MVDTPQLTLSDLIAFTREAKPQWVCIKGVSKPALSAAKRCTEVGERPRYGIVQEDITRGRDRRFNISCDYTENAPREARAFTDLVRLMSKQIHSLRLSKKATPTSSHQSIAITL